MQIRAAVVALTLALGLATPLAAEEARFDLVLRGITAGSLSWSGSGTPGGTYSVAGRLKTSGLAAMLKRLRYDAQAKGQITAQGDFQPASYVEDADTGRRQSQSQITYAKGVPQVTQSKSDRKPRPWDIDAAGQTGTVDPLTAMFAALRDVAPGKECGVNLQVFDGRRASAVSTAAPSRQGDRVVCAGEYRRIAGFSPEDMAEKTRFPFTLTYAPAADGKMRVIEVSMESLYGKARLVRQ
ncbi:MAG: hypothetical protein A2092_11905 [Rhodobacteraceae bacterium GWE1_64_9]|nr:MAG: hypothetical protein A2092_11905 [Rhodobacteraceae bacterium GWE1_64_9]HBD89673.1 DUF3108 domain-containing protein [Gemmobacter sp.]HBU14668.1 DUF3108 domain-containing protein [Gemmobacter sp.]